APPRTGLARLAVPLGERARRRFVYVSCDPATLARDLAELSGVGFRVADARLYDLFPLTHRVESVVTLLRGAGAACSGRSRGPAMRRRSGQRRRSPRGSFSGPARA